MFGAFTSFGKLGSLARAVSAAWSPLSLWPDGISSAGMWISPRTLTSEWQDYTGTTPVSVPGTVADTSNPVGLALDIRAGATVLTDPGNHMLQSTSAARPLMSARVNLLNYSQDFSNAAWAVFNGPAKVGVAPIAGPSGSVAYEVSMGVSGGYIGIAGAFFQALSAIPEGLKTPSIYARAKTGTSSLRLSFTDQSSIYGSSDIAINDSSWTRLSFSDTPLNGFVSGNFAVRSNVEGNSGNVYLAEAQFQSGPLTDYQSVPGDGSTYATDFPIYQKYDGVDDGMATAAFTAGTLTSAMDCMIPVRRDSAAACVAGLYNGIADATKFFGMAESASGSGCVGSGAGTPTVWVDGVQLSGGTAVTRGTLHTALTVGDYHILEFRGLDLSTWTAAGFGLYASYVFPGARGDIMLFPSTASTEDKDAARQWLADYYGVTLP